MSDDIKNAVDNANVVPDDVIAKLLKIDNLIDRELKIKEEAERLGVSCGTIKAECRRQQKDLVSNVSAMQSHWDVEPWPQRVDPGELFRRIKDHLRLHVVMSEHSAIATALWVMFAWVHAAAVHSPILLVSSPEAECGKSTLLALINYLVRRGIIIVEATSSVIYRMIERYRPTLIVDEADSIFKNNPELRGIINSGWTRGTGVPRCHPDTHEPEFFETFGPKAIGLKGLNIPDTTLSRSIVIDLQRKLPTDTAKNFAHIDNDDLRKIRRQLARFAEDYTERLAVCSPRMPDGFANRLEANWRILFSIADLCGAGTQAREAAKALSHRADEASLGAEMLRDIRTIIGDRDHVRSEELTNRLGEMHDRPWAEMPWTGKPITPAQLAKMLKAYRVRPKNIRFDDDRVLKGYDAADLEPAWRYIPPDPPELAATPLQSQNSAKNAATNVAASGGSVAAHVAANVAAKIAGNGQCSGVAADLGVRPGQNACAHCGDPAEEGNPIIATVVSAGGEKLPLHDHCRAEWFNQTRGE